MRVYEAIVDLLVDSGVDTVFAVMGDGNLHLLAELGCRDGVRIVHARHEQGAVAMADGYARTTGRLGVATVTHGPGLTNTATALATAAAHGTPLLLIAGALANGDVHNLQRLDQEPFVRVLGAESIPLTRRGAPDVAEALRLAHLGRTVVLHAPTDLQRAEAAPAAGRPAEQTERAAVAAPEVLQEVADALQAARRPVVLAGRGASSDAAVDAVTRMAQAMQVPIVTSLLGKGSFAASGLTAGVAGGLGDAGASELLAGADLVLAIGASLNEWTTTRGSFAEKARIIHVDRSAAAFGRFQAVDTAILADAAAFADGVAALLPAADVRSPAVPERRRISPPAVAADTAALDPHAACVRLNELLPQDRIVVVDGGHLCMWATQLIDVHAPRSFTHGFSFGSIAQSLALGIGAAAGGSGRRTVAVMGDGAAAMSIAELETAARYRLPLTIVVLSDGGFGIERHSLRFEGLPEAEADYPAPSFAALATAWGVTAARVEKAADWDAVPTVLAARGPSLIELVLDGEVVNPTFREIKTLIR